MITISAIPEDTLDQLIHKRIFGANDEAPPYSSHDPTAMRVIERMKQLEWGVDVRSDPDVFVVSVSRAGDRIETSAPTFAEAVCLAAKRASETNGWGMQFTQVIPVDLNADESLRQREE